MTVLEQYQRLECSALWRENEHAQKREVIVALGEASLVITDKAMRPLSHWSLPALERLNAGEMPARYRPGGDAVEELEIDDELMVEGVETVRNAIEKRRAHPGRVRTVIFVSFLSALVVLSIFWLPGAMLRYTAAAVPDVKRAEIGDRVLGHIHRISGGECSSDRADVGMATLQRRLSLPEADRIAVLADGTRMTAHLPGGLILANRALVEDFDAPDVMAGYVIAEAVRARSTDPLLSLLEFAGLGATFRLLTTGDLPKESMNEFGEYLLTAEGQPVDDKVLLSSFARARVPSTPYAYDVDFSGETTSELIRNDPFGSAGAPEILSDSHWVAIQGICGQ